MDTAGLDSGSPRLLLGGVRSQCGVLRNLAGVLIAIALSIAEFIARLARPHEAVLGFVPDRAGMHDIDDHDAPTTIPGLLVFRYDAPLFFLNAYDFSYKVSGALEPDTRGDPEHGGQRRTRHHRAEHPEGADWTGWPPMTSTLLAWVKNDVLILMKNHGVAAVIDEENMYPTLPTAVTSITASTRTRHQTRTSEPGDLGEDTVCPDGSGTGLHDQYAPGLSLRSWSKVPPVV